MIEHRRGPARGRGPHLPPEGVLGQRIGVAVAGSGMHFIMAIVLAFAAVRFVGQQDIHRWAVDSAAPGSAAADRRASDTAIGSSSVAGKRSSTYDADVRRRSRSHPDEQIDIGVVRDGRHLTIPTTLGVQGARSSAPSARTVARASTTARSRSTRSTRRRASTRPGCATATSSRRSTAWRMHLVDGPGTAAAKAAKGGHLDVDHRTRRPHGRRGGRPRAPRSRRRSRPASSVSGQELARATSGRARRRWRVVLAVRPGRAGHGRAASARSSTPPTSGRLRQGR